LMEEVSSSEMLAKIYQTTWHYIIENSTLHSHCLENLKSRKSVYFNDIVACIPVAGKRPINSNRGMVFSVWSLTRCYKQDRVS
jgi:hypothetical protein